MLLATRASVSPVRGSLEALFLEGVVSHGNETVYGEFEH
jgi:hypothetical protein